MAPRFGFLAALTCALMVAFVPSAHAAKGMEVAVQDDAVLVLGLYGNAEKALNLSQNLNASWIRVNVNWNYVVGRQARQRKAPRRIKYNWSGFDGIVRYAGDHGLQVQFALTGPAPAWATANHKVGGVKPKAGPFKTFARAVAQHFNGRVHRYSIWNEPNYVSWISPLKSAARVYRGLYTSGYSAIKGVDRSAQVLIAETSPFALRKRATAPLAFLRGVTCANARYKRARRCGTLKTDGFAHHPYDFDHPPTFKYPGKDNVTLATLGRLTTALSKLRKARLLTTPSGGVPELYLTEYGYFASGKRKVSRSKHASYLVKAFTMAQRNPRVREMLQYLILQPSSKYRFFDTSVTSSRGTPRLPYNKLAAWAQQMVDAGQIVGNHLPEATGQPDTGSSGSPGSGGSPDNGGGSTPPPSCAPLPICP
jgi:hypothetical protein